MENSGAIVAFVGLDGAGKSTQIRRLMGRLREQGREPVYIWTRGGYTPLFSVLKAFSRRLLRSAAPKPGHSQRRTRAFRNPWIRNLWLALSFLDLILVLAVQVRWHRLRGRVVVCDRYLWDTLVDLRLFFPAAEAENWLLWKALMKVAPQPDALFALLVPVEESLRRSRVKKEPFPDSAEVLSTRLRQYSLLAQTMDWCILDGCRPEQDLSDEIWSHLGAISGLGGPHQGPDTRRAIAP